MAGVTANDRGWTLHLLGEVELSAGPARVDLGPAKQRGVLAALAMTPGRTVSVATLVDRVWGERPPRSTNAIAPYAARLRRLLPDGVAALRFTAGGYRLECARDIVDLHRARRIAGAARRARAAGDDEAAAALFGAALDGWSAEPLAGLSGEWAARTRAALVAERLDLYAERAGSQLACARYAEVVDELRPVLAERPAAEGVAAALIRALACSGRTAAALTAYAEVRAAVAAELGSEPSPGLRELHVRILRGQLPDPPAAAALPRPSTLPPETAGFIAREDELDRLDLLLAGDTAVPRIAAVWGAAGIGKTALAVRWAHRAAPAFPDGVLYADLRGFDAAGTATAVGDVLRDLLEALGVGADRIPSTVDARTGLYRSTVAGRRVLVVLDNARDADQARPLLPGSVTCATLVTSRADLTGLVAREGARPLVLDLLGPDDAYRLLSARLGAGRLAAEPAAVRRITAACGGLPLALAVVAARAAVHPAAPLAAVSEALDRTLREERPLDAFAGTDPAADVRAVLSWSYRQLGPAATLFRRIGLAPGGLTAAAAASLLGETPEGTRRRLAELLAAGLLGEPVPGRYALHDLLHAYAAELATGADAPEERRAAQQRLLDHYVHTSIAATRVVRPYRTVMSAPPPRAGVTTAPVEDKQQALDWFRAERPALLAVLRRAAAAGDDTESWRLADGLIAYLDLTGTWREVREAATLGRRAAERAGDLYGQGRMHMAFAVGADRHGDNEVAKEAYLAALEVFRRLGDATAMGDAHNNLARVLSREDRNTDAVRHVHEALELYRAVGDDHRHARSLSGLAWYEVMLGDVAAALRHCEEALSALRAVDDTDGIAATLDTVATAHQRLGDHAAARTAYRQALDLHQHDGDRYNEAVVLAHLGDNADAAGSAEEAREYWTAALQIFEQMGNPDAVALRAKLTR
jgi:DNA-binding SARP family transcriptional activator/tetratricopeptide (TPR) repeat protein